MQDIDDDDLGPNNTLDGLLRKLEDGKAINDFGHEVQKYIAELRKAASRRGARTVGKVTITLTLPMGSDGYMLPAIDLKTKAIPKPKRPESTIYVDEDGDINGMPVPKQTTIFEVKGKTAKDPAPPAAKAL